MDASSGPTRRIALAGLSRVALRLGIVGLAGYGVLLAWSRLQFILLPFVIAVLLAALLAPLTHVLRRRLRLPRVVAAIVSVVALAAFVLGLLALVAPGIVSQAEDIGGQVERGIRQIPDALRDLGLEDADIQRYSQDLSDQLEDSIGDIGSLLGTGVVTAAQGVVNLAASVFLTLMMLIYLLIDGDGFWRGFLRFAPADRRQAWHDAGTRTWTALTSYVRSQVLVAAIDGIGITVGLLVLGVPLAVPLGILTFVLAFIPYVGAIVAGLAAVLVALSSNGTDAAIGALVVVLLVQQLEGNVLQPILIGRSVSLHPLTVLLGVGAGSALLGLTGAFLAAPVIAGVSAAAGWLDEDDDGADAGGDADGGRDPASDGAEDRAANDGVGSGESDPASDGAGDRDTGDGGARGESGPGGGGPGTGTGSGPAAGDARSPGDAPA